MTKMFFYLYQRYLAGILRPLPICLWYVVNIHFQKNLRGGGAGNVKFPILGENGQISGAVSNVRQCGECEEVLTSGIVMFIRVDMERYSTEK